MENKIKKLMEDTWAKARNISMANPEMNAVDYCKRQRAFEEFMEDSQKEIKKIVENV